LAAVQHVLEAVTDADDEPLSDLSVHSVHKELPNETTSEDSADPEDQLAASVFELAGETRSWIEKDRAERESREEPGNQAAAFEFGAEIVSSPTEQRDATPRSCRNLFTLLRRKQQGRL